MMTGMAILMITAWIIRDFGSSRDKDFDILDNVASVEWDTLLFFFGVMFSVGGLGFLGYLELHPRLSMMAGAQARQISDGLSHPPLSTIFQSCLLF
ncbi:MAG: hypothetical protein R3D66_02280 [Alphaproteobacteria bacterium]